MVELDGRIRFLDRYDAAIAVMVPLPDSPERRQLRRRLMTARDLATRAISSRNLTTEELAINRVILTVSAAYCFADDDSETLREAARLCVRLLQCAARLGELEEPRGGD